MTFSLKPRFAGIFLLCLLLCTSLFSQKKYPSLLWEITGNGLSKPSYLYGTMHVSSKLAFHLSDSFFVAVNSVNTVGLESNPDQWLKNMKQSGLLEQLSNVNLGSNSDFYGEAFKPQIPANRQYGEMLNNDPDIINNLLYRNSTRGSEHEEDTYVDLFIYKAGSRLGKKIVSLEDFNTSLIMASKASAADVNYTYNPSRSKIDYFKVQEDIKQSYKSGDLDVLDSLTQLTYKYQNTKKYLIDDRNIIMAHNIDSICKTGSLFSGIGAAHLPGKTGVIELLRAMGYKLRPVANTITKKGSRQKEAIEAIQKKNPFSLQYSKDSLFTYELFEAPVNLASIGGLSFDLATDMTNGSYYVISRQLTYASLYNGNEATMMAKIDSLLYEYVPGKIISKKEITSNTGVKGLDIVNRTKRGDYQRAMIFFPENEVLVIKMSGKGDYITGSEGNRFFSSIKFVTKKQGERYTYSPPTGGFSVNANQSSRYLYSKRSATQGLAETWFSYDKKEQTTNGVIQYYYNDFDYLEEDTFELNMLSKSTLKNFNFSTNTKQELTREQGFSCIRFSGENTAIGKTFYGKVFIKGVHYYLVYAIANSTAAYPTDFFSSFKLNDFKYLNEIKVITDKDYAFSVKDELTPGDKNYLEEAMAVFYEGQQKERDKKNYSTEFDYNSKSKSYYSPSSAERVHVEYEKFNDYDYRNPAEFWTDVKKNATRSLIVSKVTMGKEHSCETMELILKDTACSSMIRQKFYLKDGLLYNISAVCDTTTGLTGWAADFFATFKPSDSVFTKSIYINKTALLLKGLNSADSSVKYAATQSLYNNYMDPIAAKEVIAYLGSPEFLKIGEEARAVLLINAGTFKNESVIPVYKKLYDHYEDSSYMQVCIIKGLAYLRTKNSYATIFDLLKNKTPLTGDESTVNDVLAPLYDSLELCTGFFPDLLSLSTFEVYRTPIFTLFSDMVIRDLMPSAKYAAKVPALLADASNELKRYNTSSSKSGKASYGEDDAAAAMQMAEELAAAISDEKDGLNTTNNTKSSKKTYPSYSAMIENYAVVLAPYYASNPGVKAYFDKLFRLKNERNLLNITVIATKNKIPVNDTLWKFFSNNPKTKLKTYNELSMLKMTDKFDKTNLSQEAFCKTKIEADISMYDYSDNNSSLKEKARPDSVVFIRKEAVKNKNEKGDIYFFERINQESKQKTLACAFVPTSAAITTNIEVLESDYAPEIGKGMDESIKAVCEEFYYKGRMRYKAGKNTDLSFLNNYNLED
jgi:uncharacterized protein YbaP (TraB family)